VNAAEEETKMTPPGSTLADMSTVLPGFRAYWDAPENLFLEADGSYWACGVLAMAAEFVIENHRNLSDEAWVGLARQVRLLYDQSDDMRGCLGACFIENLEFKACSTTVRKYVKPEILNHFHYEGKVDS
jgi:hypothetical protein